MLNIKKAITVSGILLNNFVSLSLILVLFLGLGNAYAQMPPVPDFPQGRKLDLKHPLNLRERGLSPSAISENVEFVGATEGAVGNVFVQGNYAYLCAWSFLVILDISEPAHPTKVGNIALDGASGVYVSGSYAYVAGGWEGLRVIDISYPSNPKEVGFYDTPGEAYEVFVSGSYAYVADGTGGLRVIDISFPSSPKEVGFYDTPGWAYGVFVSGSYAYVADDYEGLHIIDISSPSNPKEVGFYNTLGRAWGVYVSGGLIYVADEWRGLYILRYTGGEPTCGDVSGDGNITAFDAALILQVVVGILNLGDTKYLTLERADVTGNEIVSALDAALVLQYTVGLITEFPCQRPTGAPALNSEAEPKLLAEGIKQLETVPLSIDGQQVLKSLKRLAAKPRAGSDTSPYTALFQNFPNPFNPDTWLPYQIAKDTSVTIGIYNVKGQLIRTLDLGNQKAGVYVTENRAAYWDGRDNVGEKVASGVYFYTLRVGDFTTTRKMTILK